MKSEMVDDPKAKTKFERTMKALFRVPKAEVEKAEKQYKAKRKRRKA